MGSGRILVTEAQNRPGLAAIRCLRANGFRVSAVANSKLAVGLWSRACSAKWVLPDPAEATEEFVAGLEKIVAEVPHDVLLAGTDEALFAISAHRDRLAPHVELGLPAHEVVRRALDKTVLATEAAAARFGAPESRICHTLEEAREAAAAFGFPVLVKGVRAIVTSAGGLTRYASRLASDDEELVRAQSELGSCIIQRRETGNVISFGGVLTGAGMLGTLVARYRRTWPPRAGYAAFIETVVPPDDLRERVQALVEGIGWQGLFELEMMETEEGEIRPIDFNPRLYGSLTLSSQAGAPLAALWCWSLLGEHPRAVLARPGVAFRWEDGDARHVAWLLANRNYRAAAGACVPRRGTTHAYFRAGDPAPFVVRGAELIRGRVGRARGRA